MKLLFLAYRRLHSHILSQQRKKLICTTIILFYVFLHFNRNHIIVSKSLVLLRQFIWNTLHVLKLYKWGLFELHNHHIRHFHHNLPLKKQKQKQKILSVPITVILCSNLTLEPMEPPVIFLSLEKCTAPSFHTNGAIHLWYFGYRFFHLTDIL